MIPPSDVAVGSPWLRLARFAGLAVAALGGVVLTGWITDLPMLKSAASGLVAMKANTSLCFVLAGLALCGVAGERPKLGAGVAATVVVLCVVTLSQDLLDLNLGIDELLFRDPAHSPLTGEPGRMSPLSAIAFALSGTALVLAAWGPRLALGSQLFALAAGSIALVVLTGYLLELDSFTVLPRYTSMALHTSLGLLALSGGALMLHSGRGFVATLSDLSEGGRLARRLLPFTLGLPLFVAAMILGAERIELVGLELGLSTGALVAALVLSALTWWTAREVDEREVRLERQRQWFATTLASIGDGVIAVDARERVRFLNSEAQRLTGWSSGEARNRPLDEVFRILDEAERQPVELPSREVLRNRAAVALDNRTLLVSRQGEEFAIDDSAAPILDAEGEILGVVIVFRDVGERRARQRELEQSRNLLAERARELEVQDQRKDEFLAVLGHELRNPVAAIASGVQLLEGGDGRDLERVRTMMDRQVGQLTSLLNDLLDLSRVSRGKISLRREVHDLAPIVRDAIGFFATQIEAGGQSLRLELEEGETLCAHVDRTRIEQVVANLLGNALKFTHAGGQIEVGLRREGNWITLAVRDDGVGMGPEALVRCFDPFAQEKPGGGGLGIGLALVRQLVELHGGRVSAQSAGPGRGSEFRVSLPALEDARSG